MSDLVVTGKSTYVSERDNLIVCHVLLTETFLHLRCKDLRSAKDPATICAVLAVTSVVLAPVADAENEGTDNGGDSCG